MNTDVRSGRILATLVAVGVALTACASRSGTLTSQSRGEPPSPAAPDETTVRQLLNRITFGPRPGDVEAVERMGLAAFLDRQLRPETIDDRRLEARLAALPTLTVPPPRLAEEYFRPAEQERKRRQAEAASPRRTAGPEGPGGSAPPAPDPEVFARERQVMKDLAAQKILRAVFTERQLQEVLVDFWFNHFNVFAGKGADRLYVADYERSAIRPHVLGTYRELLGAVARSPAMLFYLDNWMSTDPNGIHPATPLQARRVQLARPPLRPPAARAAARTGLNENYARELMELHTLGVDGGYTQRDVTEVARCFTGWTIAKPQDGGAFAFDLRRHDEGAKIVLGHHIKAGGGQRDGEQVLDILAAQPATARFIATKLARRLVADDPPPSLVDRAAATFTSTGGTLREVVRTILTSPEFVHSREDKIKTPLEFVVSALRATDARIEDPSRVVLTLRQLGMPLYECQPPTGYPDRADAWVTAGALVSRMNFATALVTNRLPGLFVDLTALAGSTDPTAARLQLARWFVGPDAGPSTRLPAQQTRLSDVAALAIGSPEFQRR